MAEFKFENGEWWYCWGKTNKTRAEYRKCEYCGEEFLVMKSRKSKYCSKICSGFASGDARPKGKDHYAWKGGVIERGGYAYVHKEHVISQEVSMQEIVPTEENLVFEEGEWWYYFGCGDLKGRYRSRTRAQQFVCLRCKKTFWTGHKKAKYCSHSCHFKNNTVNGKGELSHFWKGGVRVVPKGYAEVYVGDLPGTTRKYKRRNRLVMEEMLGRELLPSEHVHHINGNKLDDRPENLELWTTNHPYGVRSEVLVEPEYSI
jgi:hypothetical protein